MNLITHSFWYDLSILTVIETEACCTLYTVQNYLFLPPSLKGSILKRGGGGIDLISLWGNNGVFWCILNIRTLSTSDNI